LWRFRSQANLWIFSEGQNLIIEYRRSDDPRGVSVAGAELLGANFDLIVAVGPEVALRAVIDAGRPIPIVVQAINYDPIARGFVASLARPGGKHYGAVLSTGGIGRQKSRATDAGNSRKKNLGVLWDTLVTEEFEAAQRAAKPLGLELHAVKLEHPPYNFPAALQAIARAGAQMLLVLSSPLFALHRHEVSLSSIGCQPCSSLRAMSKPAD